MPFTAKELPDLKGNVFLVTGGNNGIGHSTVVGLVDKGARVYIGARSEKKAQAVIDELRLKKADSDVHFLQLDLMRFASVVAAAKAFKAQETQLNGLINNAGIMGTPFAITEDGWEAQFQTNYLSHWLLTYHLLPVLQRTAAAGQPGDVRIVNVSSDAHSHFAPKDGIHFADISLSTESGRARYGQSKLANILHSLHLNTLYGPRRPGEIWSASLHPGIVQTNLLSDADSFGPSWLRRAALTGGIYMGLLTSEVNGARSSLWAAASTTFKRDDSGGYVVPYAKMGKPSAFGRDPKLAAKLWTWTEDQLRPKGLLEL